MLISESLTSDFGIADNPCGQWTKIDQGHIVVQACFALDNLRVDDDAATTDCHGHTIDKMRATAVTAKLSLNFQGISLKSLSLLPETFIHTSETAPR